MGKNLDMNEIFNSYMNNVLLKEDNNNPLQGVTDAIPKLQELLNTAGLSEEAKKNIQAQIDNAKKATVQPQVSPSPSPSPAPQAASTPSTAPQASSAPSQAATPDPSKKEQRIKQLEGLLKTYGTNENTKNDPKVKAIQSELDTLKTTTPAAAIQPASQPITKTQDGGMSLNGITIGSPTGAGTSQQQIPSAAGVDVKIPATLQSPELMQQQPAAASTTQLTATQPATAKPKTSGGSIVDYLASKGQPTDKVSRAKLAAQYGIQGYDFSAAKNTELLNKLKSGEKPQAPAQTTTKQPKGMGGIVGGASKAIGSVGQGIKQATIGTKKPLGGILGGISKGLGAVGKGVKTALVGNQEESEENCEECEKNNMSRLNKNTVQEKNNISKFLKHLSEKNYSSAHKYLKAILNSKINNIVSERIDKNFK